MTAAERFVKRMLGGVFGGNPSEVVEKHGLGEEHGDKEWRESSLEVALNYLNDAKNDEIKPNVFSKGWALKKGKESGDKKQKNGKTEKKKVDENPTKTAQDSLYEALVADESPKDKTLAEHDKERHPDGFNPETDTCKFRERQEKKDEADELEVDKGMGRSSGVDITIQANQTNENVYEGLSKKKVKDYKERMAKKHPELDAELILTELGKIKNKKLQGDAFAWVMKGAVRLPEDMYKVEQARELATKAKRDPLQWETPQACINELTGQGHKISAKPITVEELKNNPLMSDYRDEGYGVETFQVEDSREGQELMRQVINTHWGKDANPWCLLHGDGEGNLSDGSDGGYDAWQYWQHYNALPKRVAFKDGKLLAFMATDYVANPDWRAQDWEEFEEGKWANEYDKAVLEGYEYSMSDYMEDKHPEVVERYENQSQYIPEQWWDRQDSPHEGIPIGDTEIPNDRLHRRVRQGELKGEKITVPHGEPRYLGTEGKPGFKKWGGGEDLLIQEVTREGDVIDYRGTALPVPQHITRADGKEELYDSYGDLKQVTEYDSDGRLKERYTYSEESVGKRGAMKRYLSRHEEGDMDEGWHSNGVRSYLTKGEETTEWYPNGYIMEKSVDYGDGQTRRYKWDYDGNLIYEVFKREGSIFPDQREVSEDDKKRFRQTEPDKEAFRKPLEEPHGLWETYEAHETNVEDELVSALLGDAFVSDEQLPQGETLQEHDRKHHKKGFNPETDSCKFREELKKETETDKGDEVDVDRGREEGIEVDGEGKGKKPLVSAEEDAEYLEAVKKGDMETAAKMVREVAGRAFPNTKVVDEDGLPKIVFHNSDSSFTVPSVPWEGPIEWEGLPGLFFADREQPQYGRNKISCFVNLMNPLDMNDGDRSFLHGRSSNQIDAFTKQYEDAIKAGEKEFEFRDDGVLKITPKGMSLLKNDGYFGEHPEDEIGKVVEYAVMSERQVKSADPVTYDDDGNVIPLSRRFDDGDDIRGDVSSGKKDDSSRLDEENDRGDIERKSVITPEEDSEFADLASRIEGLMERNEKIPQEIKELQDKGAKKEISWDDFFKARKELNDELDRNNDSIKKLTKKIEKKFRQAAAKAFPNTKAVGKDGLPLIVFHGTVRPRKDMFTEFSDRPIFAFKREGLAAQYTHSRRDMWVSPDRTGHVIPMVMNLENPLEIDAGKRLWSNIKVDWSDEPVDTEAICKYAKENGHDGVIIHNVRDNMFDNDRASGDEYIAFSSNQVKDCGGIYTMEEGKGLSHDYEVLVSVAGNTKDDSGNVIPLSQRLDRTKKDIRYSMSDDGEEFGDSFYGEVYPDRKQSYSSEFGKDYAEDGEKASEAYRENFTKDGKYKSPFEGGRFRNEILEKAREGQRGQESEVWDEASRANAEAAGRVLGGILGGVSFMLAEKPYRGREEVDTRFNPENPDIRFKNPAGKVVGEYNRATNQITLYPGAKIKDVVHEYSHGLWQFAEQEAKAGRDGLQKKLHQIAHAAPEKVKEAVGRSYYDQDPNVVLEECFTHEMARRSEKNKAFAEAIKTASGKNWYKRAWGAIKDTWKGFASKFGFNKADTSRIDDMTSGEAADYILTQMAQGKKFGNVSGEDDSSTETRMAKESSNSDTYVLPSGRKIPSAQKYLHTDTKGNPHDEMWSVFLEKQTGDGRVSQEFSDVVEGLFSGKDIDADTIKSLPEWKKAMEREKEIQKKLQETHGIDSTVKIQTEERERFRDAIIRAAMSDHISKTVPIEGTDSEFETNEGLKDGESYDVEKGRNICIVIGLPAAGKSTSFANPLAKKFKARLCDSDTIKKVLPEFNNGYGGNLVHEESTMLNEEILNRSIEQGDNIVYPILGYKPEKLENMFKMLRDKGYKINLCLKDMPANIAKGRLLGRFLSKGRYLPIECITKAQGKFADCFERVKGLVDAYVRATSDIDGSNERIIDKKGDLI